MYEWAFLEEESCHDVKFPTRAVKYITVDSRLVALVLKRPLPDVRIAVRWFVRGMHMCTCAWNSVVSALLKAATAKSFLAFRLAHVLRVRDNSLKRKEPTMSDNLCDVAKAFSSFAWNDRDIPWHLP